MTEIIHIAGPCITFDTVRRQRCSWCGALIDERDLARTAVKVDETASAEVQQHEANEVLASAWRGLVAIDGNVKWAVPEPEDGNAPDLACMRLDAEVTT